MRAKTWTPAIVVAGLLGAGLSGVEVAGQAPASRAERLRRETDNVASSRYNSLQVSCITSVWDTSDPG